ncbi:MAG: ATP-binding protein [Methanobacteriota archaeon]
MERYCSNCGTVNYDDQAAQCTNCGADLPEDAATQEAPHERVPTAEVPGDQMSCPECGTLVGSGAKICPSCSASLEHFVRCPSCGKGVDEIAEICPNCFNPIKKTEESWDAGSVGGGKPGPVPEDEPKAEEKPKTPEAPAEPEAEPETVEEAEAPKKKRFGFGKKKAAGEEEQAAETPDIAVEEDDAESGEPAEEEVAEEEAPKKKRFGFGKKKAEPQDDGEGDETAEDEAAEDGDDFEEDDDLDESERAKLRKDERKRKIKEMLEEEKSEGFLNYFRVSNITVTFFTFLALFMFIEFILFTFNISNKIPRSMLIFAPMLGGAITVNLLLITVIITAVDALLHTWDTKLNVFASIWVSFAMLIGIFITAFYQQGGSETIDLLGGIVMIIVLATMIILDFIAYMNYPAVLEDPGRAHFELYLDKENDIDQIKTDMETEMEKMREEEEERLRLKDEELKEIQQRLESMTEQIAQEEEKVRLKEQEVSAIQAELEMKNEALAAEEEKLHMKEQEMESLVQTEVERKTEEFMMEEEEKIRMKEQDLIKARSDLEIQRNLFDESREKLRMKEGELSHLKQELENQIRQRLEEEEKLKLKAAAGRMVEQTKQKRVLFPFVALVGQEKMKKAMILNAIYPEVGGVLIRGQKGTGKSVGVRGLAEVLPDIEVTGCKFICDPKEVDKLCPECAARYEAGKLETFTRQVQVVDLPLNITEDRLVGSIDIEKILSEGTKSFEPGILAEAHRGILYVDEINLLDDYIVDILLDSASSGNVNVEREGISLSHPARFIIVGSMNPEEGELRPQILDRIALQTDVIGIQDVTSRIDIVRRREEFTVDPEGFRAKHEPVRQELRERITKAREILPNVRTPQHVYDLIAQVCIDFNVDGHRADIIIERAARANAAFEGRLEVAAEDIVVVSEMALPHRMRRRPYEEEEFSEEMLRKLVKQRERESIDGRKG